MISNVLARNMLSSVASVGRFPGSASAPAIYNERESDFYTRGPKNYKTGDGLQIAAVISENPRLGMLIDETDSQFSPIFNHHR